MIDTFWPLPVLLLVIVLSSHLDVVLAQDISTQCVQVTNVNSPEPCPCSEVSFSFSLEGERPVADNVVNIALILDGSHSVGSTNFDTEKEFAKSVTASFAESNLFANGGTSSYAQFGGNVDVWNTGTFYSVDDFNDFVDDNTFIDEVRSICAGIYAGIDLFIDAPDAFAAFMFVVVHGDDETSGNVLGCADYARGYGITLVAIGVGDDALSDTLLDIAGSDEYVFRVDYFDELESLVDDLVEACTTPCPATNVELSMTFGATVVSTNFPDAIIDGTLVIFNVDTLGGNLTQFWVVLNSCGTSGSAFHLFQYIEYNDDQGNSPDFTALLDTTIETCPEAYTTTDVAATATSPPAAPSLSASTKKASLECPNESKNNMDCYRK